MNTQEKNTQDRKAAISAYKKRERAIGIYELRCAAADAVWVGQTTNLDAIWNRMRFTLEHRSHPNRSLQAAWNAHGEHAIALGVLERIEDEESSYILNGLLKERCAAWRTRLGAQAI